MVFGGFESCCNGLLTGFDSAFNYRFKGGGFVFVYKPHMRQSKQLYKPKWRHKRPY